MNLQKLESAKMIRKILLVLFLIAISFIIIFFIFNMYQLKKLEKMSSGEVIDFITKYDYEIGSISKTFVGLMLSKAIEENKIDIKSSISEYLPLDKDFGISVIGLILEEIYNEDFVTLMNDFIVNDLKLKDTKAAAGTGNLSGYWNWKENDGYIPAGAIISNIEEMAQYLKYYMNDEDSYISNTYAELKTIDANHSAYEKMNIRMDKIGMTWVIDEKNNIIWHNGGTSNFNSYIAFNKNKNIGVIVLGNIAPAKKVPMTVLGTKLINELN